MDLSNLIPNPEGYEPEDILTSGLPPLVKSEVKTILNDAFQKILFKEPEESPSEAKEEPEEKSPKDEGSEESSNSDEESSDSVLDNIDDEKEDTKNQNDLRFASSILASVIRDLSKDDLLDAFTLIKKASLEIDAIGSRDLKPLQLNLNRIATDLEEIING